MKPVLIIYNPKAGSSCLRRIQAACKKQGIPATFHRIQPRLKQLIEKAANDGCEVIGAAGGDGTVNAVAACVVGTNLKLAVIPCGTLNHFAKDMHIPLEVEDAVALLKSSHTQKVDVGEVNGRVFVNNSSIGIYPALVRERDKHAHIYGKWPAALWALLKVTFKVRRRRLTLVADGKTLERRTSFLFVGNNSYQIDEFGLSNREHLDQGRLSVYLIKTTNSLAILRILLRSLIGAAKGERDFEVFSAQTLEVQTQRPELHVAFDGEVATMKTPLTYKTRRSSLRVIVPVKD